MSKVAVYIPCCNYARFLDKAVESVLQQVYSDWELILVDEGSIDGTKEKIERYEASYPDRVKAIYHDQPKGLQKTANEVLGIISSSYVMRLDADDWLEENALLLMVSHLDKDQEIGLVFGDYYLVNILGEKIAIEESEPFEGYVPYGYKPAHGACTMVRTRLLKAAGGYSEQIDAQDGWDLWYKIARESRVSRIALPLFYYRQHGQSLSKKFDRLLNARRKIFDLLARRSGGYIPSILAVIGVKESYAGNPNVPFQKVGESTLLEHTLNEIVKSKFVTSVIVSSTSDRVIEDVLTNSGKDLGKPVYVVHRAQGEQENYLPIDSILKSSLSEYQQQTHTTPDIVLFCSLHSIGRKSSHIDHAINMLLVTQQDSVVSTVEQRDLLFKHQEDGLSVLNPGRVLGINKENEKLYKYNGALIAVWVEILVEKGMLGDKVGSFEMTSEESRIYISTSNNVHGIH